MLLSRGKLLNVRDASASQITNNAEISNIKQIMGLQYGKVIRVTLNAAPSVCFTRLEDLKSSRVHWCRPQCNLHLGDAALV